VSATVFDLFKLGVGPSSSHTTGPMLAALGFRHSLAVSGAFKSVARLRIDLYGSLALTGKGHGTDRAVILGLAGFDPAYDHPDAMTAAVWKIAKEQCLYLKNGHAVPFAESSDICFHMTERLPHHSNGMRFSAYSSSGETLGEQTVYSIGGGAILDAAAYRKNSPAEPDTRFPHPFGSARELLNLAEVRGLGLADLAFENECALRAPGEVEEQLRQIVTAMDACIARGIENEGLLPGGLHVPRRAAAIHRKLTASSFEAAADPLAVLDWVKLWALAVNEENAAGGRVVTAPTNGAAGIIPAVLTFYRRFVPNADWQGTRDFLLVAGLIGNLFKKNASISGAEVGCQGEVGVACSMAAGGLAAVLGGSNAQIENAAEIAMEHNLGLTCDPIGGLVQVPCIERNAIGAVKAIEAARLALLGDGRHHVSLDHVIASMLQTGRDMSDRYKETALGGLATNVVEC
jgi:L-serine dehydratase